MFEYREAVPTPLGGGTIAHSPIRAAHLAPCHDIPVTLSAKYFATEIPGPRNPRPLKGLNSNAANVPESTLSGLMWL